MSLTSKEIRRQFIDFFAARGHTFVPSSSLLPADDPTLLFANAGMNQFKDVFLGAGRRPYPRAVNSQKCIRAGGKHNDLEDVGHDTYHHTFFEMLGNWSFGDYFKREAITWAWELLTGVWGLPAERLWATVFGGDAALGLEGDAEAESLWPEVTGIPRQRVLHGSAKDNFWEMGETGPCGPCTEIHFDRGQGACDGSRHGGAECAVNVSGCGRFVELWNLVFIQFNRNADGLLSRLPARHVDTGMGFERVCAVLQGKTDNYAGDVFAPLMDWLTKRTGIAYGAPDMECGGLAMECGDGIAALAAVKPVPRADDHAYQPPKLDVRKHGHSQTAGGDHATQETDVALRVIADHARSCAFAIADGVLPSNDGRGYVVRRILRRAARFGRKLGLHEPFLHELSGVVADQLGEVFPELAQRRKQVAATIKDEEVSFNRTLDRGIDLFERAAGKAKDALTGDVVFELYATYGFPVDLTQLMAGERGLTVDMAGYEAEMVKHREISSVKGGPITSGYLQPTRTGELWVKDDKNLEEDDARVIATLRIERDKSGKLRVTGSVLNEGDEGIVFLNQSPFYAESGGQVGDTGVIEQPTGTFQVTDTRKEQWSPVVPANYCHFGKVAKGTIQAHMSGARPAPAEPVPSISGHARAVVDAERRMDTRRNHTATHLLNWALREVLGEGVDQAGSVVEPGRLRFDFTAAAAVTDEQLAAVERLVNARALADEPVTAETMPLAEAKELPGVRAVFGEKYPDPVRVIRVGHEGETQSAEFCGGTHLDRTSQIGFFKIVGEESVAKGVRRITAVTGREAVATIQQTHSAAHTAAAALRIPVEELPDRIAAMQKEIKDLRKARAAGGGSGGALDELAASAEVVGGVKVIVGEIDAEDPEQMRSAVDQLRQKAGGLAVVMVGSRRGDRPTLVAGVAEEVVKSKSVKAGDWVKAAAAVMGGGGGGKPTMAQAGGKEPDKLPDALQAGRDWMRSRLA